MKNTLYIVILLLIHSELFSQNPKDFVYQLVVRDSNKILISSTNVGVRLSIIQGSEFGNIVYSENQHVLTNLNGMATLTIGTGNVEVGTFNNIDWAHGPFFIKSEVDIFGGNNYTYPSTNQILVSHFL